MKGDFSRITFDPLLGYTRVLQQQGRVLLDADTNEQTDSLLYQMRALIRDLIGPHAGVSETDFAVRPAMDARHVPLRFDFEIAPGRYYVDGIPAVNGAALRYTAQRAFPFDTRPAIAGGQTYLVYLDVWERVVTSIDEPRLADVALGGPDTALRTQVVWQVRLLDVIDAPRQTHFKWDHDRFLHRLAANDIMLPGTGRLAAGTGASGENDGGAAGNGYTGLDNRLYRIEIHEPGRASTGTSKCDQTSAATYKWSRENGSALFSVIGVDGDTPDGLARVRIGRPGLEAGHDLSAQDTVEPVDDDAVLRNAPYPLLNIRAVDRDEGIVVLEGPLPHGFGRDPGKHPALRLWDHGAQRAPDANARNGALLVRAEASETWLEIEHGISIRFDAAGCYRAGDYWLIPARANGNIEWSGGFRAPRGEAHHYAPLAVVSFDRNGALASVRSMRRVLRQRWR